MSSETTRPSESQVEAAKLLIRMLEKDGEPVDAELRAVADADPVDDEPESTELSVQDERGQPIDLSPALYAAMLELMRHRGSTRKIAGESRIWLPRFRLRTKPTKKQPVRRHVHVHGGVASLGLAADPVVEAAVEAANRAERDRIAARRAGDTKPLQ